MKVIYSGIIFVLVIVLALFGVNQYIAYQERVQFSGNALNLYNWGDYIDPELIQQFQDETGIQVVYNTFDSNEAAYNKVKQGGSAIDVMIPSDYTISKMTKEDMLLPLNKALIPHFSFLDETFLKKSFDPENTYSAPYFWGTVGILYNKSMVETAPTSFKDLWDTRYKNNVLLVDGAREIIGMALNSEGYSLNSRDLNELNQASDKLRLLAPNIKAVVGDEIKTLMANNEAAMAVIWSGEAAEAMSNNEDLDYVIPSEGTNLWFDNMVIPKGAKHIEEANQFINFMLKPENAAKNANYVGYATPVKAAMEMIQSESEAGVLDERFYPNEERIKKLEVYADLGIESLIVYNDLFLKFKIEI